MHRTDLEQIIVEKVKEQTQMNSVNAQLISAVGESTFFSKQSSHVDLRKFGVYEKLFN